MPWTSNLARFVAVYAMLYAAFGIMSPFLPEFLRQRGLTATEIGAVIALGTAAGPKRGRALLVDGMTRENASAPTRDMTHGRMSVLRSGAAIDSNV